VSTRVDERTKPKKSDRALKTLDRLMRDKDIDTVSAADRMKLQQEWCRATGKGFSQPDGAKLEDF